MTDIWNLYTNENELFASEQIKQMSDSITEAVVQTISRQCENIEIDATVSEKTVESLG